MLIGATCIVEVDVECEVDLQRLRDLPLMRERSDDRDRSQPADLDLVRHATSVVAGTGDPTARAGQARMVDSHRRPPVDQNRTVTSDDSSPTEPEHATSGRIDLSGRTFVVTGGNGGIGLGMAEGISQAGGSVSVWGRNGGKNDAAVDDLRRIASAAGTDARFTSHVCDVSDEAQVCDVMERTVSEHGRLDGLFANAGRGGTGTPFLDTSLDAWRSVMAVNLDGVFLTLREAAKVMVEQGTGGSLVAVSSTSAVHGAAGNEAYGCLLYTSDAADDRPRV